MARTAPIGVGIIGANPERGWATVAHIPALGALPDDYVLRAVSTSRPETAAASSERYGVPGFADAAELIARSDVDLVVITVKVPAHRALVDAALAAGKMVYCEWPLGNGLADAEAMAEHAGRRGIATAVGLQARTAPLVRYLGDLVRQGYVGEVLSTTLIGSGNNWGAKMLRANAYTADDANGATLLTIPVGHTLEAVCSVLGEFTELSASSAIRRPTSTMVETGEAIAMRTPDQWAMSGTLASGAFATVHYRGGASRGTNLHWEINGTEGDLVLSGGPGGAQMATMQLLGGRGDTRTVEPLPLPQDYVTVPAAPAGSPFNVAHFYRSFADDLRNGTHQTPDFAAAVQRHKLMEAALRAAATGQRQVL